MRASRRLLRASSCRIEFPNQYPIGAVMIQLADGQVLEKAVEAGLEQGHVAARNPAHLSNAGVLKGQREIDQSAV